MLGLFKAKPPVGEDEFEWLLASFAWPMREFGGIERLRATPLVLPTTAFFPRSTVAGHARALELFGQVKAIAGMADRQCDLFAGAASREMRVATGLALKHHSHQPAGTFGYRDGRYYVTYNPSELARPEALIATFAHELGHYLLHDAITRPPGGAELEEHATDLASTFLGFGVFSANASKEFRQFQNYGEIGWQMQTLGYLSELAHVTALAIFIRLSGAEPAAAERALKAYLRAPLRKALAAIDRRHGDLATALAAIDLSDWG